MSSSVVGQVQVQAGLTLSAPVKKRIGIDVDDVLADFVSTFVSICNKLYGTPLDLKPTDWEWSNFGLSKEQISEVWNVIRQVPLFWYMLSPAEGATQKGFEALKDAKLYFITARFDTQESAEDQTAAFLQYHFGIRFPQTLVGTPKGLTAAALGLTHFIDDRPENCVDVADNAPNCQVFIKDTTHNRHFNDPRIQRIGSFDEFARLIGGQSSYVH